MKDGVMDNPFSIDQHPNCFAGHQYAIDVLDGKIPNCKFVIGACRRYLKDFEKTEYFFDADRAERYLRLVQKFNHPIGEWKTKTLIYEPWQKFCFMNIIGWRHAGTNLPRFRVAHIEVPRGNGKSSMSSGTALYFLNLDDPKGNIISCFGTKSDQARIVLDGARIMALNNPSYRRATNTQVLAHTILHKKSHSKIRAMSADSKSLDGLNDILSVMDELHAMERKLFDVVYSGMSKRRDSLMLCITTAGFNQDSVGHSQSSYAKKVCLGHVDDDQFFAIVYTIDEGDDIFSELSWKKANPNYDVSVDPVTFAAKAKKAEETPEDVANFKVKHLNIWISEANSFFSVEKWDACADPTLSLDQFRGKPCRLGLDLASHIDLTSIGFVFFVDGIYYVFDNSFIPEATMDKVRNSLYEECVGKGFLTKTPGEVINYDKIRERLEEISKQFRVTECMYDAWRATEMAQKLAGKIEMVKFAQNVGNFSEPMKRLDTLIRQGKVKHNGSPLLRWCLSNVVAKRDHNDNVFPRKSHERLKIDPIVALIMALAGWIQDGDKTSVYETRGIRTL